MRLAALVLASLVSGAASAEPLTLRALIERARTADPRVREAQAQLRFLKAKYEEARWAWFPRVDSYVAVAGPTPEARNDGLGGPPTTHATLMYDLDFGHPGVGLRAGAEAVLPLYTFGKLDALKGAGAQGVKAGEALVRGAADEAELRVTQAFYGYCLARASGESLQETIQRLEEAKATLERLKAQGSEQVTQVDAYRLDYYRQQAEAQRAAAEAGAGYALAAIRLLIAARSDEVVEVAAIALEEPDGTLQPLESYLELARRHRPELEAVAAAVAVREHEVFIRERMYLPDFALVGFFRWMWTTSSTRQLSPFAYDPYNDLAAGVALAMRYQWDFPQKGLYLEQARAELERTQHQASLAGAAVRMEIEKLWSEANAALTRAARQTASERSARRWATAAFAAFDLGTGETRELVEAFTALAMSSAQRGQAYHDLHVGLAALSRAVGEPLALVPAAQLTPPLIRSQERAP